MLDKVWHYFDVVIRHAGQLERTHWIILSVIVLGLGVACMKGFGSRNDY